MQKVSKEMGKEEQMTVGKTHDTQHFVDTGIAMFKLDNLLGVTIGGDGSTSQEYYLGEDYAESSIHAVGGDISFSTIYDNVEFNMLVAAVIANPNLQPRYLVLANKAPKMFRTMITSWPQVGLEAPSDGPIIRPWSLMRSSIGDVGVKVTPFDITGTAITTIAEDFDEANGLRAGIVITELSANITNIVISGRVGVPFYNNASRRPGIKMFDVVVGAVADLRLKLTGQNNSNIKGYVVQGDEEVIPNG